MFKNLKAKVKQDTSSSPIQAPSPVITSNTRKKSINDDSKSNSSKLTDELQSSIAPSSSDEVNFSIIHNKSVNSIEKPFEDVESTNENNSLNGSNSEIELSQEKNENLVEKIKLQKYNEQLLQKIEVLTEEIRMKSTEINRHKFETKNLYDNLDEYKLLFEDFETNIKTLQNEKDELIIKNAELSEKLELLKMVNQKEESSLIGHHALGNTKSNDIEIFSQLDSANKTSPIIENFNIENHEQYQQQMEENKSLRTDLNEKNKVIKNLTQRLNDMKKTLQKELNYQNIQLPNEKKSEGSEFKISSPQNKLSPSHKTQSNRSINRQLYANGPNLSLSSTKQMEALNLGGTSKAEACHLSSLHDDVNFKYMKHVVLKFLCSREYEAIHLIKALSVLLNFSNEEEKLLKETLEWKMSWFGTRPKIR